MKRAVDIVVSLLLLVVLSPVIVAVGAVVALCLGRPILFRQSRPGLHSKIFTLYKFKTMLEEFDPSGQLLPDDIRLTRCGRFLRSFSLDELPELWNVLRGDMSLVGPRPLSVSYLDLYTNHQARRHNIRPGITGWAQINGRNETTWDDRLDMDVWYVDNRTCGLDAQILFRTIKVVLTRKGVSAKGHATMPKFEGR